VRVLPGNEDIWELLRMATRQWRFDFSGPVGLDYGVIFEMARSLGIEIGRDFLEKLHAYEAEILRIRTDKEQPDGCNAKKEAACRIQFGEMFEATCRKCPLNPDNK